MTLPALGLEERVGIGMEAWNGYGTRVSPTVGILTEAFGMEKVQPREAVPGRFGPVRGYRGTAGGNARRIALPGKAQGPMTLPFSFGTGPMLLAYGLLCKDDGGGTPVGYTFDDLLDADGGTGAGEPNQHKFKMQNHTGAMPRSMTLTRFSGYRQDAFMGTHMRGLEIAVPENGVAMMNVDLLGQDLFPGPGDTPLSETLPAIDLSAPYARITEAAVSYSATVGAARSTLTPFGNVHSLSIRVNHTLRELAASKSVAIDTLSTVNPIAQPIPIDYSVVEGSFRTDWNQDTWQDIWNATTVDGTYVCLEIRLTSEVLTSGALSPFEFVCRIPAAHLTGMYPKDGGGPGPVPEEIGFQADVFDTGGVTETVDFEFYNDEVALTTALLA
jgi:hypothetical protein